jgi:hypothetical protein
MRVSHATATSDLIAMRLAAGSQAAGLEEATGHTGIMAQRLPQLHLTLYALRDHSLKANRPPRRWHVEIAKYAPE